MELGRVIIMEDGRVYLRLMTREDTENIIKWRNSDEVRNQFIYQKLFTKESHENWIKTMVETGKAVQMIIVLNEGDRPIGSVYVRDIDMEHKKAEYGIFIGETDCYGKGYGTEAAELMCEYAFSYLGLHKLMLRVYAENERAIKSYEKSRLCKRSLFKRGCFCTGKI